MLEEEHTPRITVHLERVNYVTRDTVMNIGGPNFDNYFWQVRHILNRPRSKTINPDILFQTQLYFMPYKQEYFRVIYNIKNLLSEIGGYIKACTLIALALIYPISRHLFYTHVM